MRQPLRKDRHWFIVPCAVASLGALAAAGFQLFVHRDLDVFANPLEAIELVLIEFLCLGAAALFGWVAIGVARGPSLTPPKRIASEEWGALFGLALGAALFDMVAIRCMILLRDGLAESNVGVGLVLVFSGALGALMSYGVVVTFWDLLRRRPTRVILPDRPILAGTRFTGALEIALPAERAPAMRATLSLTRTVSSPLDGDFAPIQRTIWCEDYRLEDWHVAGPGRARAEFHFDLPADVPCDLYADRISYAWQLIARPLEQRTRVGGSFSIPVAFEDPFEEGVLART